MLKFDRVLRVMSEPGLCAGDWVEVKSKEEILATLDQDGNLDGMPFMPEMLKYCGQHVRVYKRAHKTCDYSKTMESRRVPSAVHLENVRCTGEAHGGCQAECMLFWKDAWLKPVEGMTSSLGKSIAAREQVPARAPGATEAQLHAATRVAAEAESIYSCQTTRIPKFTTSLPPSHMDQYVEAYVSRNYRLRELFAPLMFRVFGKLVRSRFGASGVPQRIYDLFQKLRGGIPWPNRPGFIPSGEKTPVGERLNLLPGDIVRVKSLEEIRKTINREGLNRGLLFSQELVPYCGQIFRVHSRVKRIIDEKNGKMLNFKNDCIILENVICQARYNEGLSFCPRSNYPYWREIWLERVAPGEVPGHLAAPLCGAPAVCS